MRDRISLQVYYARIEDLVCDKLDREDPQYLLKVDPTAYLDHLVSQIEWQPLIWHEEEMSVEPFSKKRERHDEFFPQTHMEDVACLRLRVPVSPHPQRDLYVEAVPSTIWGTRSEPKWEFKGDCLVIEVGATESAVEEALAAV